MAWGKLFGIGVGPGDPELLTLKAQRILRELDILFVPKSTMEKRSLALSIVLQTVHKDWNIVELIMPMIKDPGELKRHWEQAADQVIYLLQEGRSGAFITLGDPSLYSTFTYLMTQVQLNNPQIEVEIIPGVSAINMMAARLQKALVEGDENLVIAPALLAKEKLEEYLAGFDNIVLLKAGRQVEMLAEILSEHSNEWHTYLASRCGFDDETLTDDLRSCIGHDMDYLSSVLIKRNRKGGVK